MAYVRRRNCGGDCACAPCQAKANPRGMARLTTLEAKVRRKNGADAMPAWARNLALLYAKANDVTEESLRLDRMNQDRVNQGLAPDAAATVAHHDLVADVKAWVDAQNWGGTEYGYKPLVRWPTHVSHFRARPTHKNPARKNGDGEGFTRAYSDLCHANRAGHIAAADRYDDEAKRNPGGPAAQAQLAHWGAARRWEECTAFVPGGMTAKAQRAAVRKAEAASKRTLEADAAWADYRAAIDRIKARHARLTNTTNPTGAIRNHHIRIGGTFYTPGGRKGTVLSESPGYYRVRWSDGTLGSVQDSEMTAYPTAGSRANQGAARTAAMYLPTARKNPGEAYLTGGFHFSRGGFPTREAALNHASRENAASYRTHGVTYKVKIVKGDDGFNLYFGPLFDQTKANPGGAGVRAIGDHVTLADGRRGTVTAFRNGGMADIDVGRGIVVRQPTSTLKPIHTLLHTRGSK